MQDFQAVELSLCQVSIDDKQDQVGLGGGLNRQLFALHPIGLIQTRRVDQEYTPTVIRLPCTTVNAARLAM